MCLSLSILAAYDFGATSKQLQAIYDDEAKILKPIDTSPSYDTPQGQQVDISITNWQTFLGNQKCVSPSLPLPRR